VTEQQWRTCTDPKPMLRFLRGKASDRKLRLLACACCRRVWDSLSAEESRQAVLVAERFADGLASADELAAAGRRATRPARDAAAKRISNSPGAAGKAAAALVGSAAYSRIHAAYGDPLRKDAPQQAAKELGLSAEAALDPRDAYVEAEAHEAAEQTALVRDLFADPFRAMPTIDPAWLAWNDGTLRKLAQAIYVERAFDRMPVLADALEEAGCTSQDILSHCREVGQPVRGCWVIDLLLGRR
jgi:hypothetical protein